MHNLSGLLMFLSLTVASLLWALLGKRLLASTGFALFSIVCSVLAVATVVLMAQAVEAGRLFGLYQRINYGISVAWVAVLALMSLRGAAASLRFDRA